MSPQPVFREAYFKNCIKTLEIALQRVPPYQSWRPYDLGSSYTVDERFQALPILSKDEYKRFSPDCFVPVERDIREAIERGEIEYVITNGISGEKIKILWSQSWWDKTEQASWALNAHTSTAHLGKHREAILTSALCVGVLSDDYDLSFDERKNDRFLYLNEKSSPLLWQKHHFERIVAELQRFKPLVLEANPSFLSRFARFITKNHLHVFQPSLVLLTYELPSLFDLQDIRQVFNCPICNSYGSTEAGHIFMECEFGRFHQNTTWCRVDLEPLELDCTSADIYRIIVTTFNNPWGVLLRYDTGDLCKSTKDFVCRCGRQEGLIIDRLEGRTRNLTMTVDGKLVTEKQVDLALSGIKSISTYQLVQISANEYLLRFNSKGKTNSIEKLAIAHLRDLYGDSANFFFSEENIQPEKSGKFRRVFSTIHD